MILNILNTQIKNGNIKLCGSNGPSWPITAITFCRTTIRLRNRLLYSYRFTVCRRRLPLHETKLHHRFFWMNFVKILQISLLLKHMRTNTSVPSAALPVF